MIEITREDAQRLRTEAFEHTMDHASEGSHFCPNECSENFLMLSINRILKEKQSDPVPDQKDQEVARKPADTSGHWPRLDPADKA